jgi:hypothetical protein
VGREAEAEEGEADRGDCRRGSGGRLVAARARSHNGESVIVGGGDGGEDSNGGKLWRDESHTHRHVDHSTGGGRRRGRRG